MESVHRHALKAYCTLQVRVVYRAPDNNRSYSILLSEACVAVEQEAHDSVISIKLSELAMGIHGVVEDHVINVFKGVYICVCTHNYACMHILAPMNETNKY